jgi:beta-lactamase regulating signal transducer with metallopeptidase domain
MMIALESSAILILAAEMTIKSLIVIVAALTITWFMRRSSAAARHLYLSVAVVALLLLPLASVILPSWKIGIIPNPLVSVTESTALVPVEKPALGMTPDVESPVAGRDAKADLSALADRTLTQDAGVPTRTAGTRKARTSEVLSWILYVWAIGGSILLLRLIGGKLYGIWIAGRAPAVEDKRILAAVGRIADRFGIKRNLLVVESDHLKVPFVSGIFRPRLVMPSLASSWSSERIEAILYHEFAHIKRKDILTQFYAQIACCIYWINPLTWIMERRLFIERERACDDFAITKNIKAAEYAGYLMEVMEELKTRRSHVWVMSSMAEGTDFKDRILSILDPIASRSVPRLTHTILVIALAFLVFLPLSTLNPWAEPGSIVDDAMRSPVGEEARIDADLMKPLVGADRRMDALIALLESPDSSERSHAATALGTLGNRDAVPALIESLRDGNESVREHAATALGNIRDKRALPSLIVLLSSDRNARVREHSASAIGHIGGNEAYEALIEAFKNDGDVNVRAHAAYGLGFVRDERALDLLTEGLYSEHSVIRAHCLEALVMIGGRRFEAQVKRALRDPSQDVRESANRALQKLSK